jgi:hypothetical protein
MWFGRSCSVRCQPACAAAAATTDPRQHCHISNCPSFSVIYMLISEEHMPVMYMTDRHSEWGNTTQQHSTGISHRASSHEACQEMC